MTQSILRVAERLGVDCDDVRTSCRSHCPGPTLNVPPAGSCGPAFRTYGDGPSTSGTIEARDSHIAELSIVDYPSPQHDRTVSGDEQKELNCGRMAAFRRRYRLTRAHQCADAARQMPHLCGLQTGGIGLAPKNFEQPQIDPGLVWHREVDGLAHPASPQTLAVFICT